MNYPETLQYLFRQLPMFTRVGASAYKKDLSNTLALCKLLDQPEQKIRCIHIAGTNGKGSTSHMLASVLQEAGYKTGLYTSPHLKDFRERIRINGILIPEHEVVQFVEQYKVACENIQPSFFEWTVALCFDYFAREKVDVAFIETGLGGRLDSTNVITPLLSVITNIGWDHTDLLGNSLELIAEEKAGIIKPGIPVIIGETQVETSSVFLKKAKDQHAPLQFADQQIQLSSFQPVHDGILFSTASFQDLLCDLGGLYQQNNVKAVLASIKNLQDQGFIIDEVHIRQGLQRVKSNTGLMGRWQILGNDPLMVCDTGHNVNGLEFVIRQLKLQSFKVLHMVIGMVKDKDISKVLAILPRDAVYYFCNADIPRALPAEELRQQAEVFHLHGSAFGSVKLAIQAAQTMASKKDMIFIGGSTFVVAEAI
ncbi:MAG: folylpolyglutamate synthase/dihydrofolate synthase family protein [Bacteroidia bacterium]